MKPFFTALKSIAYNFGWLLPVVGWLAIIVISFMSIPASARPMTATECAGLGNGAEQIAKYRDQKAPIEVVKQAYIDAGRKNRSLPASYVQTDEDELMLPALVDLVYANPSIPPEKMGLLVFKGCYLAGQKAGIREL